MANTDTLHTIAKNTAWPTRIVDEDQYDFSADMLEGLARALREGRAEGVAVAALRTTEGSRIYCWTVQLPNDSGVAL